jgi:hypothetical protein
MEAATLCAEQARIKVGYYRDRDKYMNKIRDGHGSSQFSGIVPLVDIPDAWIQKRAGLLEKLIDVLPALEALHGLMAAVWSVLSVDLNQVKQSRSDLESNSDLLVALLPEISSHMNVNQWCGLCIRRDAMRLGALGRDLINTVYSQLNEETGIEFKRVQSHYDDLIADYPLPTNRFEPGF